MNIFRKTLLAACASATVAAAPNQSANAQVTNTQLLGQLNTITTAVPFLMISPDAKAGAMGDAGVATTPDANNAHWNPAKTAFSEDDLGISISYTPWLRQLVPDISLGYVGFYKKIDDLQGFGGSLRYFSLGDISFTDFAGNSIGTFNPNEFSIDGHYARKVSDNFSVAIGLRFIYSNLTGGLDAQNQTKAGISGAGDLAFFYKRDIQLGLRDANLSAGLNFSNLGAKIAYSASGQDNFLPANMRLGTQLRVDIDDYNQIAFTADVNKLLVPTNPVFARDSTGRIVVNPDGSYQISEGEDPFGKSVVGGVFGSFSDSPGGFREEMREINYSAGVEYWYDKQFAIRGGYFYEWPTKGGRQFFTMGAGLKYNVFNINFSYLIPFSTQTGPVQQRSPLQNTLRFSLAFNLGAFR